MKEIRAGTTLRRTGQNSIHRHRRGTSQLNKEDLEKLTQIMEKAASTPRKVLSPTIGNAPQFNFPVADMAGDRAESNGIDVCAGDEGLKAENKNGYNGDKTSSNQSQGTVHKANEVPPESSTNSKLEGKSTISDQQGGDQEIPPVSQPALLTSPSVGDTANNSPRLPTSQTNLGKEECATDTMSINKEKGSLEKGGGRVSQSRESSESPFHMMVSHSRINIALFPGHSQLFQRCMLEKREGLVSKSHVHDITTM